MMKVYLNVKHRLNEYIYIYIYIIMNEIKHEDQE